MKRTLITFALVAAAFPALADEPINYSVLAYGASVHMDRMGHRDGKLYRVTGDRELDGSNPGLGLEAQRGGWLIGAGTYRDSWYKQAYMTYGGYRWVFGNPQGWNANLALKVGYLNGSGHHGLMALPTAGIGYKHVSLEFSAFPYDKDGNGGRGLVIATWLRYQF